MFALAQTDIFATKGAEYLLVIVFLAALLWFWRVLTAPVRQPAMAAMAAGASSGWFDAREGVYYHTGHTWASAGSDGLVTVGVDDFAQKLLGKVRAVGLPDPGTWVRQGDGTCTLTVDTASFKLPAPVDGQVVAWNPEVVERPGLVNHEPYERGWLFKIRVPDLKANIASLLHGSAARDWMHSTEDAIRSLASDDLGLVMQDGGVPVSGIARAISPDDWEKVARRFLESR